MAREAHPNDPVPPEDQPPAVDSLSFDQPAQDATEVSAQPRVEMTFDLPPGMRVRVTVETLAPDGSPVGAASLTTSGPLSSSAGADATIIIKPVLLDHPISKPGWSDWQSRFPFLRQAWHARPGWLARAASPLVLMILSGLVYLAVRLIGLQNFPVYFFCDEAVNTVLAMDLAAHNFQDSLGQVLPTFFRNGGQYSQGVPVYLQVLPTLLLGNSVFVVRALTVAISLVGAIWVGLILRDIFKARTWWAGVLLLSAMPIWFLFSRTGFEYCLMASFYAGFLYYYLLYRSRGGRTLYPALILGALTFYTYGPGQFLMVATGLFLLISDWRYHWKQPRLVLRGLGLLGLLAIPLVRFMVTNPQEYINRLQMYASVWSGSRPLADKVFYTLGNYLEGLNPLYWFLPNSNDLPRYALKGYADLGWPLLPFVTLGIARVVRRFRLPEYRVILMALLAAPTGAVVIGVTTNRDIAITVSAAVLALLGLEAILDWLKDRWPGLAGSILTRLAPPVLLLLLAAVNAGMLVDVLKNGPTWTTDYGLSGLQYGARQVFAAADTYQRQYPDMQVVVSPNWSFQTEVVKRFFLPQVDHVTVGTADAYMQMVQPDLEHKLFVFTPADYQKVVASNCFQDVKVEQILDYPNGQPGFYFARLQYRSDIAQVIQKENDRRNSLVWDELTLNGTLVQAGHSDLVVGPLANAFDGDLGTLIKTREANPLVIELDFPEPVEMSGLMVRVGAETVRVTARLTLTEDPFTLEYSQQASAGLGNKDVQVNFRGPVKVTKLHLEVLDVYVPEPANVHLWEVTFR